MSPLGGKVKSPGPICCVPSSLLNNPETGSYLLLQPESLSKDDRAEAPSGRHIADRW